MITSCCSSGSSVFVTDTPTVVVLSVDGVATLIPKFKDCDGADLAGGAQLAKCSDVDDAIADLANTQIGDLPVVPRIGG
jgi:hypothetical protein